MIARALALAAAALALNAAPAFAQSKTDGLATATFAGGCFWCMEDAYDRVPGIVSTTSGYIGGSTRNPSYPEVSSGATGHTEAVQVRYDPAKVSYEKLLEVFWKNIDPTVKNRQFCDVGTQYRTGIFVHDDKQLRLAETSRAAIEKSKPFKAPIVTPVVMAGEFWPAEEYHQDYHLKNPARYKFYVTGCGRYSRLKDLWGSEPH